VKIVLFRELLHEVIQRAIVVEIELLDEGFLGSPFFSAVFPTAAEVILAQVSVVINWGSPREL
jgi:hypothetical protein